MFAQSNQTEWTESQSFRGLQGYRLPSNDTVMAGCPLSIILGELIQFIIQHFLASGGGLCIISRCGAKQPFSLFSIK